MKLYLSRKPVKPEYKDGDIRTRRVFLFTPKTEYFTSNKLVRWLEFATIVEKYYDDWDECYWIFIRFAD